MARAVDLRGGLSHTDRVRLLQFTTSGLGPRVARVDGDVLRVLAGPASTYELARTAIARGLSLIEAVAEYESEEGVDYEEVVEEQRGAAAREILGGDGLALAVEVFERERGDLGDILGPVGLVTSTIRRPPT